MVSTYTQNKDMIWLVLKTRTCNSIHAYIHTYLVASSDAVDPCPLFRTALLPRLVAMLYIRSDRRYQGRSPPQEQQHDVQGHPDLAGPEYVSWESPRSTSGRRHTHRQMDRHGHRYQRAVRQMVTISHVCMYVCMYVWWICECCIDDRFSFM